MAKIAHRRWNLAIAAAVWGRRRWSMVRAAEEELTAPKTSIHSYCSNCPQDQHLVMLLDSLHEARWYSLRVCQPYFAGSRLVGLNISTDSSQKYLFLATGYA
jgi:hypothetical protein